MTTMLREDGRMQQPTQSPQGAGPQVTIKRMLRLAALALVSACVLSATGAWRDATAQSLFEWERDAWRDGRGQQQDRRARDQRRADYCRQLEQRLVQEWRRSNQNRGQLPDLQKQLRQAEDAFRDVKAKADRRSCYEQTFFFGRSLRRTPECVALDSEARKAQRQVELLRDQIERIRRTGSVQSRQDDLIAELARYGCGEDYERQYEARRPTFFSFFDDRGTSTRQPRQQRSPSELPFATYRTMCVRRCDGFYFPMSFSTLPSQFQSDETQCRQRCAAPTELFVYRNPGEDVDSMVSLEGRPYTQLKNAWLYRKEFIDGCSCDASEYSASKIAQSSPEAGDESNRLEEGGGWDTQADGGEGAATPEAGEEALDRDGSQDDSFDPRRR